MNDHEDDTGHPAPSEPGSTAADAPHNPDLPPAPDTARGQRSGAASAGDAAGVAGPVGSERGPVGPADADGTPESAADGLATPGETTAVSHGRHAADRLGGKSSHRMGSGRLRTPPGAPPGRARRSPWNRRRDWVVVAGIAVLVAVLSTIVAVKSDNLHTSRALADPAAALPAAPDAVPGSMTQLWQAPSAATPEPIGQADTVTTADGGEVAGRDPRTGQIRWHYTRENLQLCTVDTAWGRINAVYHKSMGCSEITQLDPATGRITAQRNGDAELGTRLVSDGTHVTTTGKHLLDTWRDDLVKSMEYGKVPFLQNPNKQPRTGCTYGTVAAAAEKIGVIERCPGDPRDRLTVYRATAEHEDEPQVVFSTVLPGSRARVIAMSGDLTAVLLPDKKQLVTFTGNGTEKTAYPMDLPAGELAGDPAGGTEQISRTASAVYWFTGTKTVALSRDTLAPRWILESALGPGSIFANQLVIPIRDGLAVLDETTGATLRTVGVDRHGYSGPVRLTALGPILLEQRGPTVAALR